MARRRRSVSWVVAQKSLAPPSETPKLAQPSEIPEEGTSWTPSQPELQPEKLHSSMSVHSAPQRRSAKRQSLEPLPLDSSGSTDSRMRTRASMQCLEQLERVEEKAQPQIVEPQTPVPNPPASQPHSRKQWSSSSKHLNSSGSIKNRRMTRASMRSLETLKKEEIPLPVELLPLVPLDSALQAEFLGHQPLEVSGSSKNQKRIPASTQHLGVSAREDEWLKPQLVEQQSSQPETHSQLNCVDPLSPAHIHSDFQADFQERQTLESQPLDSFGSIKKRKRHRGPTRCLELLTRVDQQLLNVAANEFGQPIGPNARKLTSFLGTVTRDPKKAPLLWHDWRAMPQEYKDRMWEHVQETFQVGDTLKDWVMMSLATKWRNFKAYLKKKHYDDKAGKDRLVINDKRVDPVHWQELVHFWDSEKGQLRSSTNKANRSKLQAIHTAGSKSFAMIREELRIKSSDLQNPSQTEVYMLTHTRKDGRPVDETSAAVMAKLSEQGSDQENPECDTPVDEALTQILGEDNHGRVRTFGLGPSPTDVYGPKPTRNQALQMVNEIKKTAEEKLTKMTEQMKAMKAEQEGMKAEQEEMKQKYEDRLTELQTQLQAVVQMVQGNNMNVQAIEQFSLQQHLFSSTSSHLLQPPGATSSLGIGSSFPSILRRRKITGEVPSHYTASSE